MIDLVVRNTAATLSVQRKDEADAKALYEEIVAALRSGDRQLLELTCEKQADKKIAVISTDISAVQMSGKSAAGTASGKAPGFFSLVNNE